MNAIGQSKENYIPVITKKEVSRVSVGEILYIETQLRVVYIYTVPRIYRFYGKMDEVIKYLNGDFYRCHKSCIVNFNKIVRMEDGIVYFKGGFTLRVGENNFRHTRSFYSKFLMDHAK
ncbi:MAG: LytTR family transcriptional regulator [Bacillota bacterium]|nr:LytTR family transcriptional regulator [Bacillota bacterium]